MGRDEFERRSHTCMLNRREFLRRSGMSVAASSFFAMGARGQAQGNTTARAQRKVILVTFGGGARDDETFSIGGQENIPHLLNELAPQGTFFPQVVNRGILGHYVATASIATGRYETFDNFVSQHPAHPTMFEYFRRELKRPREDAWVIAPSNGFDGLGWSTAAQFGAAYGAEVVLPKKLLMAAAGQLRATSLTDYEALLRDSYETPFATQMGADEEETSLERLSASLRMSPAALLEQARTLRSPDELSISIAVKLMREVAPSVMLLTLHDIDVAHSGAFSLYLEGIQRADRLCAQLWRAVEELPEYKGRTTMLVLPDFGRDADDDAGGNGFQHHRTGGPLARTTWMLALGGDARQGQVVARPLESVDVAPTIGKMLGFDAGYATGRPIEELL